MQAESSKYFNEVKAALTKNSKDPLVMKQFKGQVDKATAEFDKIATEYSNVLSKLSSTDQEVIRRSSSVEEGVHFSFSSPTVLNSEHY